jgi:serine/threonine-protein kinase
MAAARVKPGDVLGGKYKVERILGTGGMGIVVAARHIDLGQRVALKFMLSEAMSDTGHAERFLREAKAAVQLKSVHTARVLDVGRLKNDEPYMVMEYLEGRDLDAELAATGALPPHVAVDYILQASEALAEAHGLGMIHRDVKLKNLFLTTTVDGRPLVKVLDFGLAKRLGALGDVSLTSTSAVFGSPQYMSPEQMKSAKDVDFRSDIWSIGVCLYELVTGRVPFDAGGVAEICAMVLKDPVPPPSQFVRGLPQDLERVILQCLEKNPDDRLQSFAELAMALQPYASDEGSARRIIHVMQSAHKVEHVTVGLVTGPPGDGGAKTMNAWDSGGYAGTRRPTHLSPQKMGIAIVGFLALAIVGAKIGATGLDHLRARDSNARSDGVEDLPSVPATVPVEPTQPMQAATAQPTPAPVPQPGVATLLGASPSPEAPEVATAPAGVKAPARPPPRAAPVAPPTHTVVSSPKAPSNTPSPGSASSAQKPPPKSKNGPGSGAEYM